MRCGPESHTYSWASNNTVDGPPLGQPCLCGAVVFQGGDAPVLVNNPTGRCYFCNRPLDDHLGARPCHDQ